MKLKNRLDQALHTSITEFPVDLENLVDHLFGNKQMGREQSTCRWVPRTDVRESEVGYLIDVDLPGLSAEQVNVEIKEGVLEISGQREGAEEAEGERLVRSERLSGTFQRRFEFSEQVDAEKVSAEFKNGVLSLTVPKVEKELPRKIEIKVSE